MRQLVGGSALMIQALEPGAVGGQRAPAVGGNALDESIHGHVEPNRHAVLVDHGSILCVRKCPSAPRHHKVTGIDLFEKDRVLEAARRSGVPVVVTLGGGYARPLEASVRAHIGTYRAARTVWG